MGRMNNIGLMLQLAALSAMNSEGFSFDMEERKHGKERMDATNQKITEKDKAKQNGLKEFDYNGEKVYALNQKNADRKAKKLGYI